MDIREDKLRELCKIPKENRIGFVSGSYYKKDMYYGKCLIVWTENNLTRIGIFYDALGTKTQSRHFEFFGIYEERENTGSGFWRSIVKDYSK